MSKLIPILLAQHRALEGRVKSIQAAVDERDIGRIQSELPAFKSALAAHLELEDTELYPGMVALGTELGDAQLTSLAQTFASSMKQVSAGLSAFLARHQRTLDLEAFTRDWTTIAALLASRVRSEEKALFGLYDAAAVRKERPPPKPSRPLAQ